MVKIINGSERTSLLFSKLMKSVNNLKFINIDTEFIYNFIVGGLVIATSGYISKFYSSYLSGLLYGSVPFATYYLYLYTVYNSKERRDFKMRLNKGHQFINGAVIGGIIWVFMISLIYLNLENPINIVFIASVVYVFFMFIQFYTFNYNT